jgi:hypothetical protein
VDKGVDLSTGSRMRERRLELLLERLLPAQGDVVADLGKEVAKGTGQVVAQRVVKFTRGRNLFDQVRDEVGDGGDWKPSGMAEGDGTM